jgi:molybdopterin synthase sulfur carrier subunit
MEIKVFATLRDVVGGKSIQVDITQPTPAADLLRQVIAKHPALRAKLFTENGALNPSVHILINGRDVRFLDGLDTVVGAGDSVQMFPPVGGG